MQVLVVPVTIGMNRLLWTAEYLHIYISAYLHICISAYLHICLSISKKFLNLTNHFVLLLNLSYMQLQAVPRLETIDPQVFRNEYYKPQKPY